MRSRSFKLLEMHQKIDEALRRELREAEEAAMTGDTGEDDTV